MASFPQYLGNRPGRRWNLFDASMPDKDATGATVASRILDLTRNAAWKLCTKVRSE